MDERSLHIWCLAVLHIIIFVHLCVFAHHFDCVDLEEIICIALIFVISLDGICAVGEPITLFVRTLLGAI